MAKRTLTLKLDRGLHAWLKAHAAGIGLHGGMEETAIAFIRDGLIRDQASPVFAKMMLPHLPKKIRKAVARQPRMKADG